MSSIERVARRPVRRVARGCQRLLNRMDWQLTQPGSRRMPYRLRRIRLPQPHARPRRGAWREPFMLDLDVVTSVVGFSCAPGGWHPYVASLQRYREDPSLPYEESPLYDLYERFQPDSVQEALFGPDSGLALAPLDQWPPALVWQLWTLSHRAVAAARSGARIGNPDDVLYFGPVDHDKYGRGHFERLIAVYESLAEHGYRPDDYADGLVEGHFLARGADHRFVIREGHHRVAALRVLGYRHVKVRLWDGPAVVWHDDLGRWSADQGGLYPRPVIEEVFSLLLTERGDSKARTLGLI